MNSVVGMTRATSLSPLGSEFDNFLFAPIGQDKNGMRLSVLSALARLNVDPWQEADELARLPPESAIARLASRIAALPDDSSTHPDPGTIAGRLIELLPRQGRTNITSPHQPSPGGSEGINSRLASYAMLIILTLMLSAHFITANRQPQRQVDNPRAPASSTVAPDMPSPSSGQ
jgi:hypothetical protein